jgi:capsular exopolysaccharide synthesis family protein
VRPKPIQDGIKSFGMGMVLGLLLAFMFEYLDDSIQTRDDMERAVGSQVPVVGVIPVATEWRDSSRTEIISVAAPKSPTAEAYRALRTSVHFAGIEEPLTTLAITSPSVGEGKTTTLANLAVVMANSGRKVIVLDCDLRRPRVHRFFGVNNDVGFTSVLIGEAPLSMALKEVPGIPRLSLLASGPIPPNPSELLTSSRFGEVLRLLKTGDAIVLIDTPPLLPVTDAAVIAPSVDKLLLVASAGKSTRKQIRNALEILRQVDAPLAGVVLNRAETSKREGYYHYYYGRDNDSPLGRTPRMSGNGDVTYLPRHGSGGGIKPRTSGGRQG